MTVPKRIQRSRVKGWRMPEGAVNVTRPTIWGNPFIHNDPSQAVTAYREYITHSQTVFEMGPDALRFATNAHKDSLHWAFPDYVRDHIEQLRGKDLVCWCALDAPCHSDVLLELANRCLEKGAD